MGQFNRARSALFRCNPIGIGQILRVEIARRTGVPAFGVGRLGFPGIAIRPAIIQLHYLARGRDRFKSSQRVTHNRLLVSWIKRPSDRVSERIINEYAARRIAGFKNVEGAAHNDGGDAIGF